MIDLTKYPEVAHLTHEQIDELYNRYVSGESNQTLIDEYNVGIKNASMLIRVLPPQLDTHSQCPNCSDPLYRHRQSKTELNNNSKLKPQFCVNCGHEPENPKCSCSMCTEQREKAYAEFRSKVRDHWNTDKTPPIPYDDIDQTSKLKLLAAILCQLDEGEVPDENLRRISFSNGRLNNKLAPNDTLTYEIINELADTDYLIVDPESNINGFLQEKFGSYYITVVDYIVNICPSEHDSTRFTISELFGYLHSDVKTLFTGAKRAETIDYIYPSLVDLFKAELDHFFECRMTQLGFNEKPSSVDAILEQCMDSFSISQIFYFIHKAIGDAELFFREGTSKGRKHAMNTVPKRLIELSTRAVNEKWDVSKYGRAKFEKCSSLSFVVGTLLFGLTDREFIDRKLHDLWRNIALKNALKGLDHEELNLICDIYVLNGADELEQEWIKINSIPDKDNPDKQAPESLLSKPQTFVAGAECKHCSSTNTHLSIREGKPIAVCFECGKPSYYEYLTGATCKHCDSTNTIVRVEKGKPQALCLDCKKQSNFE